MFSKDWLVRQKKESRIFMYFNKNNDDISDVNYFINSDLQNGDKLIEVKQTFDSVTGDCLSYKEKEFFIQKNNTIMIARAFVITQFIKTQIVLISGAGWNTGTKKQIVSITGINEGTILMVSPASKSQKEYLNNGVRIVAQSANALVFQCNTIPTNNIMVNVLVHI